jgi:hypothetical protein
MRLDVDEGEGFHLVLMCLRQVKPNDMHELLEKDSRYAYYCKEEFLLRRCQDESKNK